MDHKSETSSFDEIESKCYEEKQEKYTVFLMRFSSLSKFDVKKDIVNSNIFHEISQEILQTKNKEFQKMALITWIQYGDVDPFYSFMVFMQPNFNQMLKVFWDNLRSLSLVLISQLLCNTNINKDLLFIQIIPLLEMDSIFNIELNEEEIEKTIIFILNIFKYEEDVYFYTQTKCEELTFFIFTNEEYSDLQMLVLKSLLDIDESNGFKIKKLVQTFDKCSFAWNNSCKRFLIYLIYQATKTNISHDLSQIILNDFLNDQESITNMILNLNYHTKMMVYSIITEKSHYEDVTLSDYLTQLIEECYDLELPNEILKQK